MDDVISMVARFSRFLVPNFEQILRVVLVTTTSIHLRIPNYYNIFSEVCQGVFKKFTIGGDGLWEFASFVEKSAERTLRIFSMG